MVINKKYKLLFIGIPYSASSAIIKELIENYNSEPLLHKHANIPYLIEIFKGLDINQFHITAVQRDPVDIVFTVFNKLKTNANGVYTDRKYFLENGGHVSKKARRTFHQVKKNNWDFLEYLKNVYSFIPYDSYISENRNYVNQWIYFDELNKGFSEMLRKAGIDQKKKLPLYNPTNKVEGKSDVPEKLIKMIFGPFLIYNKIKNYNHSISDIGYINYFKFLIFRRIRAYKWKKSDRISSGKIRSVYD